MLGNRLKTLRENLITNKIDAFLVSSSINIAYLTGYSNFSKDEREAYLFVTESTATLFTDSRYIEAVGKIIPKSVHATIERPISKKIEELVQQCKIKSIGFENNFTVDEYERFKKKISAKLILTNNIVEDLRAIKDVDEIKSINLAAQLTDRTYKFIASRIEIRITEKQIAWEMEKFIRDNGGTLAFDTIVAFGPNSSIPHHMTSDIQLKVEDEFVLLDFGAKVNGYCSDMTRTILTKNASDKANKIYSAVREAQKEAALSITANQAKNASNAAKIANNILKKNGFEDVPHGLGHGIGLEVHEYPHLHPKFEDELLITGNYFSIEPGIYIPGFGGVRIEDDYLLTEKGLEQLTHSPK